MVKFWDLRLIGRQAVDSPVDSMFALSDSAFVDYGAAEAVLRLRRPVEPGGGSPVPANPRRRRTNDSSEQGEEGGGGEEGKEEEGEGGEGEEESERGREEGSERSIHGMPVNVQDIEDEEDGVFADPEFIPWLPVPFLRSLIASDTKHLPPSANTVASKLRTTLSGTTTVLPSAAFSPDATEPYR
ncbi:unnamed protein product, partial [Symbiodinium sp. KB8]